jgi:hypothetical protein
MTGQILRFGNMIEVGNPCISNPTPQRWFNTDAFKPIPPNTYLLRTNPLQYDCLTGPKYWVLDATLIKNVAITERIHSEFKIAAYNATNRLNRSAPDTNVQSSFFGQARNQGAPGGSFGAQSQQFEGGNPAITGRQVELGLKIIF